MKLIACTPVSTLVVNHAFSKNSAKFRGFTLIELMVIIAIMGVLAMLAAPALGSFVSRSNMRSLSNDFTMGIQRTRSEAINRNECVVMCMSANVSDNSVTKPTCDTGNTNWAAGWIVFRYPACSPNSSGAFPAANYEIEDVIFRREGVDARYRLNTGSPARRYVVFNSRGVSGIGAGTFNLSDANAADADKKFDRTFCLDSMGRVRVLEYAATC